MSANVNRVDQVNLFLVLVAGIVAHILPLEALLISYAFLGPAHYLTEISWLHDRQYFAKRKIDIVPLLVLSLLTLYASDSFGLMLMFTFFMAIAMAFTDNWGYRIVSGVMGALLFVMLNSFTPTIYFFMLLPTLVHVFLFTFLFVWVGALRNDSVYAYLTMAAMILVGASYFVDLIPFYLTTPYAENSIHLYDGIYEGFLNLTGLDMQDDFTQKAAGFVGFAYTYHYLNWFSKTKIIRWHDIPKRRALAVTVIYLVSISLYLYDYALGFSVLLLLSWLHVVLEFPLNGISVSHIVKLSRQKFAKAVAS